MTKSKATSVEGLVKPSRISKSQPVIRKNRLTKIILTLYEALIHGKGLYKTVTMENIAPQIKYYPGATVLDVSEIVPSMQSTLFVTDSTAGAQERSTRTKVILLPGTPLHIRWLWIATLTDRREVSDRVYRAHCAIYHDHPELYSEEILGYSEQDMKRVLDSKRYKIGSPKESAMYWLTCARTLHTEFNGDPINLLKVAGWSVESVYTWKIEQKKLRGYDPIPGWGRKLISLYFLYLGDLGFPLPDDAFPADVHAQALMLQTGVVDFKSAEVVYSSPFAEMVRKNVTELCKKKKLDPVIVAHASWLLGSQLCTICAKTKESKVLCPVYDECRGRADTSPYTAKGLWYKNGSFMNKGGDWPKYGLPSDAPVRLRRRRDIRVIPIAPLFQ